VSFRFYTNVISQASRSLAVGSFIVGLLLLGFGLLIYALPKLFAILAALVFFAAGTACIIAAVKIFVAQRRLNKMARGSDSSYRENVSIHIEDHHD
jgi:hypothetical protein